ncbi:MAG TPA: hypothetical protein VKV74_16565 [Bryobacteraceae bacterium]|nr:hypothetical protein [Bryobacteraceae bacterium]
MTLALIVTSIAIGSAVLVGVLGYLIDRSDGRGGESPETKIQKTGAPR